MYNSAIKNVGILYKYTNITEIVIKFQEHLDISPK